MVSELSHAMRSKGRCSRGCKRQPLLSSRMDNPVDLHRLDHVLREHNRILGLQPAAEASQHDMTKNDRAPKNSVRHNHLLQDSKLQSFFLTL